MKLILLCVFLVIGVCQSSIIDSLKDGSDALYKFEYSESHAKVSEKYTFDVLVRKGFSDHNFIMLADQVKYDSNAEESVKLTNDDVAAIKLPVLINLDSKFNRDYIQAAEADTKNSLDIKDSVMDLLVFDLPESFADIKLILKDGDTKEVEVKTPHLPFGECNTHVKFVKKDKQYKIEITGKRSECTGNVEKYILKEFEAKDLTPDSEFLLGYYFEQETFRFERGIIKVTGKDADTKLPVQFESKMSFKEYKTAANELTLSSFPKKYTNSDLEKLFA